MHTDSLKTHIDVFKKMRKRKGDSEGGSLYEHVKKEKESAVDKLFFFLQTDDLDSFSSSFSPIRRQVLHLAQKRLAQDEAEDVVQQTLSTFWEKRRSVRVPENFMPFLFSILRNKIGDTYRRTERQMKSHSKGNESLDSVADSSGSNPESLYEGKELERILKEAIEICATENKLWGRILQLLEEGRSREEIRKELGDIPVATVYTRIYRARQHLLKILKDEFGVEI